MLAPPGYPTHAAFTANFDDCAARTDSCPNPTNLTDPATAKSTDTSVTDPGCSPLKDVKLLAEEIKSLKPSDPDKILVAGIFGWPRQRQAPLPYKIDLIPNPTYLPGTTAKEKIYDYWPICYDPSFPPRSDAFDAEAAGHGATGGLRLSAFVDEFGANGLKFSICEPDFTEAMSGIGNALAGRMDNFCIDYKLVDSDGNTPGLQPACYVTYRNPVVDGTTGKVTGWAEGKQPIPQCPANATPDTIQADCWRLATDTGKCRINGQHFNLVRSRSAMNLGPLPADTRVELRCRTCPDLTSGSPAAGCND